MKKWWLWIRFVSLDLTSRAVASAFKVQVFDLFFKSFSTVCRNSTCTTICTWTFDLAQTDWCINFILYVIGDWILLWAASSGSWSYDARCHQGGKYYCNITQTKSVILICNISSVIQQTKCDLVARPQHTHLTLLHDKSFAWFQNGPCSCKL